MDRNTLHHIILHEYKLGHNVTKTVENISKAWKDGTTTRKTIIIKFNKFDAGNFDFGVKPGRGRKSKVDISRLHRLVSDNSCQSTKEYARKLNVGASSVKRAFKKLNMMKKHDEAVP